MNWLRVSIKTTTEGIEAVCGRLYSVGITGLEIEDANDFNEFLESSTPYWDFVDEELMKKRDEETVVKAYISDNESGHEQLAAIRDAILQLKDYDTENNFGDLSISLESTAEQDWAENWKKYYKPLTVGEKILIVPEWETVENTDDKVVFTINPGMSFGTGTHQSTQLCIENLEKYINEGDSILDLGCGSGILSIIAMLLGAGSSFSVDIDPNAVKIALENAEKNGIDMQKYTAMAGNAVTDEAIQKKLSGEKYDIILANIVADVIISLVDTVKASLKDDGVFITSGIILERIDDVKLALEGAGFACESVIEKGEWAAISAKLKHK